MKVVIFLMLIFVVNINAKSLKFIGIDYCPIGCDPTLEDGKEGFVVDALKHIFTKYGYKVDITIMQFSRAIKQIETGKYDGIIVTGKEISPNLIYPKHSISPAQACFLVKKGDDWKFSGIESLDSRKIAAIEEFHYPDEEIDKYLKSKKDNVELLSNDKDPTKRNILKLVSGRVDTYVEGYFPAKYMLFKLGYEDKIEISQFLDKTFYGYTAFSNHNSDAQILADIFDKEFEKMLKNGELLKILKVYGIDSLDGF